VATLQTVVDLARKPLNDDDATDANRRWPDATLLNAAVHGLLNAYRTRYDLFVGGTAPSISLALGSTFPLPDEFIQPLADFVTARAHGRDDESSDAGRAAAYLQLFGATVSP
jgi:hypothetical protein